MYLVFAFGTIFFLSSIVILKAHHRTNTITITQLLQRPIDKASKIAILAISNPFKISTSSITSKIH